MTYYKSNESGTYYRKAKYGNKTWWSVKHPNAGWCMLSGDPLFKLELLMNKKHAKRYKCDKEVIAYPMNRADYNLYRGWDLPIDEDGKDLGYLVEYTEGGKGNHPEHDGYISWSPFDTFHSGYTLMEGGFITFGDAVAAMRDGKKVAREGWNGQTMFAYLVPAGSYPAITDAIKGEFANDIVPYREYLALKTAQNDIAMWSPSGSDALANDWYIVS